MSNPAPNPRGERTDSKENRELWTGILAGPVVWLVHFQIAYALVPWVCKTDHESALHVLALLCLLLALAGGRLSFSRFRLAERRAPGLSNNEPVEARARFMALLGMMNSALFSLVIIAQGIASFFVSPCQE